MLTIEGLSRHFGGLVALSGVDYAVAGEGVFGLIGPNGSGKTTLFNVVTGLYRPSAGRVRFLGEDISRQGPHRIIAKGIARTFQTPRVYARMTVRENLAAARHTLPRGERQAGGEARIEALLEATGLAERRDELAKSLPLPEHRRLDPLLG